MNQSAQEPSSQTRSKTQFEKLVDKFFELIGDVENPISPGPKEEILSGNLKTGYSVNLPIALTCRPTKICMNNCYASRPGATLTWKNSLLKQLRVYNYIRSEDPEVVAQRIINEYHKKRLNWLRWNGCGDLFPEAIEVINKICVLDPTVILLVVTRKPEMAAMISRTPNMFLMFSVDASSRRRMEAIQAADHPRLYYSFLRTSADEDTTGCNIIFDLQKLKGSLPYEPRCCPVDAHKLPLENGCNVCKRCFSERVLSGNIESESWEQYKEGNLEG